MWNGLFSPLKYEKGQLNFYDFGQQIKAERDKLIGTKFTKKVDKIKVITSWFHLFKFWLEFKNLAGLTEFYDTGKLDYNEINDIVNDLDWAQPKL